MSYIQDLGRYIASAPTAFQAVCVQREALLAAGFSELREEEKWNLRLSGSYFVTRNGSALIAFRIPKKIPKAAKIMADHADSPAFRIKNAPEMKVEDAYVKLNVESYGGAIYLTWPDRPLGIAGRVFLKSPEGLRECPVDLGRDLCMIPSLAIHMDRDVNKGHAFEVQKELLPLLTNDRKMSLKDLIAKKLKCAPDDIISTDLYLYNSEEAKIWGAKKEYFSAPRLDDAACAFAGLQAILKTRGNKDLIMHAMFDHEEVGSLSMQGACSTFLPDTLERISLALGQDREAYLQMIAASLLLSADNGHALHPNYPEKCDPTNRPKLGGGVLLKFAGNQKYTTDASSAAKIRMIAQNAGLKLQDYHNHADIPGGSTLGCLLLQQVSLQAADIGVAQLAMHSAYETCAVSDLSDLYTLAAGFFDQTI